MDNSLFSYGDIISGQNLALTTDITMEQIEKAEKKFNILDLWSGGDVPRGVAEVMKNPDFCFWAARHILNHNITPQHAVILSEMWARPFPMLIACRGWSKTYSNAMLALLTMALEPGTKIVGVGSSFRQSKLIWEYMKFIWEKAPVLRQAFPKSNKSGGNGPAMHTDRASFTLGDSTAVFIPIGTHGDKIRGLRANKIFSDEFDSIPIEIYEKVIVGFGAVSKDPVMNAVIASRRKRMIKDGEWSDDLEKRFGTQEINQQVITGTAGYGFGHFCDYWERYRKIIYNRDLEFEDADAINMESSRHNYSVIRIPYDLIPHGFMDSETIKRARSTMTKSNYGMEYEAVFARDSDGFFKRSMIDRCVTSQKNPTVIDGEEIVFKPLMRGDLDRQYVFGLDPASEQDNLSIVILELRESHTRIVHCWSINKTRFTKKVKKGLTDGEHDYFQYCVRKVRMLMSLFPCVRIMMDAQGGGFTLREAFANPKDKNDTPIFEIIEDGKKKETDNIAGLHILEMCQFANQRWLAEANHGMKQDFENQLLLFPEFDYIELAAAEEQDKYYSEGQGLDIDLISDYDTLEDVYNEIEELKQELCSIVISKTPSGVERWTTPAVAVKGASDKKDRYSSLLLANKGARDMTRVFVPPPRSSVVGYRVGEKISVRSDRESKLYSVDWYNW